MPWIGEFQDERCDWGRFMPGHTCGRIARWRIRWQAAPRAVEGTVVCTAHLQAAKRHCERDEFQAAIAERDGRE